MSSDEPARTGIYHAFAFDNPCDICPAYQYQKHTLPYSLSKSQNRILESPLPIRAQTTKIKHQSYTYNNHKRPHLSDNKMEAISKHLPKFLHSNKNVQPSTEEGTHSVDSTTRKESVAGENVTEERRTSTASGGGVEPSNAERRGSQWEAMKKDLHVRAGSTNSVWGSAV